MTVHIPRTTRGRVALAFGLPLVLSLFAAAGCRPAPPQEQPVARPLDPEKPLPVADPVEFLEKCLAEYDRRGIEGYRLVMHKQERLDGQLQPPEVIEVFFRARPYSVTMRWLQGARDVERRAVRRGRERWQDAGSPDGVGRPDQEGGGLRPRGVASARVRAVRRQGVRSSADAAAHPEGLEGLAGEGDAPGRIPRRTRTLAGRAPALLRPATAPIRKGTSARRRSTSTRKRGSRSGRC